MSEINTLTVKETSERLSAPSAVLIDVRTPGEFSRKHAANAINLPLDTISVEKVKSATDGATEFYLICQGGKRSLAACEKLCSAGLQNITNVEGGTNAWVEAGLPVVTGKGVISIERQVRIGAGVLVFAGVLLGALLSPYWLILPGFVGAGLVFAGITDFCGMGMVLAKMPWNK